MAKFLQKSKFLISGLNIALQAGGNFFIGLKVAQILSVEEQAGYYVLIAILNIPLILDFGLGFCLTQFIAHLASGINIRSPKKIIIDEKVKLELRQLLNYSHKFSVASGGIAGVISVILYITSITAATNDVRGIGFALLMFLAVYSTVILMPCYGMIEGVRMIDTSHVIRLINTMLKFGVAAFCLSSGFSFNSIIVGVCVANFISIIIISCKLYQLFREIATPLPIADNKIENQIWAMQLQVGIGCVAGYASNYLPSLMMNRILDEDTMARCAMTIALIFGVGQVAQAPIIYKQSRFSYLRSLGLMSDLKFEWFRAAATSFFLSVIGAVLLGAMLYNNNKFSGLIFYNRILGLPLFIILAISCSANQISLSIAALLRSDKRDVFAKIAVVTATTSVLGNYWLGKYFGEVGITVTYFGVSIVSLVYSSCQLNRSAIFKV